MNPAKSSLNSVVDPRDSDLQIDGQAIVRILIRRKATVIAIFVASCLATLLALAVSSRRYEATAELQVLKEDSGSSLSDALSSVGGASDALQVNLTLQTYVGLLTSDTFAIHVIDELHLEHVPEYEVPSGLFESREQKMERSLPLEQTRFRREAALRKFRRNMKVSVISGTRLLSVSFLSTNPDLAKKVLNQLLSDFVEYNFQVRYKATVRSTGWLGQQLIGLKVEMERSQEEAARLQGQTGIFGVDDAHNLVLTRLESLNQQLLSAEQNRIVKDAVRQVVTTGNPELVSNLSGTVGQSVIPGASNSLALLQLLRQQEATASTQYAELSSKYGPNYPRVTEVHDQLLAIRTSIKDEAERVTARAQSDYDVAKEQEQSIKSEFERQKSVANQANDLTIRYLIAKQEATSKRDLYEHLLEKLQEAGILAGLRSTDIDIVDSAHVGAAPATPNIRLMLAAGIGAGLLLGIAGAFLRDSFDRTVYNPEDVEALTNLALLGVIPLVGTADFPAAAQPGQTLGDSTSTSRLREPLCLAAYTHPDTPFAEALRAIRTALLLSTPDQELKVMMVTSPLSGDGKTTVSMNLACVLAQQGKRVLLVDADMRRAALSQSLGFSLNDGLSDMIVDRSRWEREPVLLAGTEGLFFLPAGPRPPYPADLLASESMKQLVGHWRTRFDYIVVDTPPVIPVTDAVVFSQDVDGVVLVLRASVTTKPSLVRSCRLLSNVQARCVGAVLNAMDVRSSDYENYSGDYTYTNATRRSSETHAV